MYQINTLHTLNLQNIIGQLYLNESGGGEKGSHFSWAWQGQTPL